VGLGDCPFDDHMRLDIWKKAHITTRLMIRCFIDRQKEVDGACWAGDSCELLSYARVIHHKMGAKPMPGGDLKSLGLSPCLSMAMNAYRSEHEQGRGQRTLLNLTTFILVS